MSATDRLRAAALAGLAGLMARLDVELPRNPYREPAADAGPPAPGLRPRRHRRRPSPLTTNRTRWLQGDVESASWLANGGDLSLAAQLYRSFQRDGQIQGLLGTRSGGLVRLPRRFLGTPDAVRSLQGEGGRPGLFDQIFPQETLEALNTDGYCLGVGAAEFVQGDGDPYPSLQRLDPEYLRFRHNENRWYYQSYQDGPLPITPGDGRWVLHTPKGRMEPWNRGLWPALGRAYVAKDHSFLYRENYAGKLANPARVATSPTGASEPQAQSWFRQVMAWGVNSVFGMRPGYDVKLLESNGRGYEVFKDIIESSNLEIMIAICGQIVTVTGGAGFANANIHATIRSDIIQGDGNALAATLSSQAFSPVIYDLVGPSDYASVAWDTRPPQDLTAGAQSLITTSQAIDALTKSLAAYGLKLDVAALLSRFAVPMGGAATAPALPDRSEAAGELPAAAAPQLGPAPVEQAPGAAA